MTLLDLIRTPASRLSATASPAIPATPTPQAAAPVARIATVAVASPAEAILANQAVAAVQQLPSPPLPIVSTDQSDLIFAYAQRLAICGELAALATTESATPPPPLRYRRI